MVRPRCRLPSSPPFSTRLQVSILFRLSLGRGNSSNKIILYVLTYNHLRLLSLVGGSGTGSLCEDGTSVRRPDTGSHPPSGEDQPDTSVRPGFRFRPSPHHHYERTPEPESPSHCGRPSRPVAHSPPSSRDSVPFDYGRTSVSGGQSDLGPRSAGTSRRPLRSDTHLRLPGGTGGGMTERRLPGRVGPRSENPVCP